MNTCRRALLVVPLLLLVCSFALQAAQEDKKETDKKETRAAPKTEATPTSTEEALFDLVNRERVARGLPPLKVNLELLRPARGNSTVLARGSRDERGGLRDDRNAIRVVEGEESTTVTPAAAEDVRVTKASAWTEGVYPLRGVVNAWVTQKECRERLLDPNLKEGAIGIVRTSRNEFYYTLMLAGPGKR